MRVRIIGAGWYGCHVGLALLAGEWERSGPPFELYGAHARELRALLAPAGTLASLDDACDGEPRPGEG